MFIKCMSCGEVFDGYPNGLGLCDKCKNKSNHSTTGGGGNNAPIIYKSERDIIINAPDKKVAQIKKFINTSIDDINKWLIENNVKEVTSYISEEKREYQQWAGGGCGRNWTETTILYKIEV